MKNKWTLLSLIFGAASLIAGFAQTYAQEKETEQMISEKVKEATGTEIIWLSNKERRQLEQVKKGRKGV